MAKSKSTGKRTAPKKTAAAGRKAGPSRTKTAKSAARPAARTGSTARARRTAGGAGAKAGFVKGEGLEVGNRRRESGRNTEPLPPAVAKEPRDKVSSTQIPGEKAVPRTEDSLPVEPPQRDGDDEPMDEAALDRRRQVIGTDDRRGRRT